jgi:hypothetical protein
MKPKWSLSEPNIASALKRNEDGKCANHKCNNRVDEDSYKFSGLMVCNDCEAKIRKMLDALEEETKKHTKDYLFSMLEGIK